MELTNFKIHTKYYRKIVGLDNKRNEIYSSISSSFLVDLAEPRNLDIDGVTNARDLGGWTYNDNSYVKQGMIYRCGRLNKSSSETIDIEITDKGKETMLKDLGIKSEIDLRVVDNNEVGSIDSSVLGDEINYYSCPMVYNGNILTLNKSIVAEVFKILGDINNYPLFIHCNIGTDRTGMYAYLINGLMGVDEYYLGKDYEFSNFANIGGYRNFSSLNTNYVKTIHDYEGDSLSDKIHNYLVNEIGVNENDLQNLKNYLTE